MRGRIGGAPVPTKIQEKGFVRLVGKKKGENKRGDFCSLKDYVASMQENGKTSLPQRTGVERTPSRAENVKKIRAISHVGYGDAAKKEK